MRANNEKSYDILSLTEKAMSNLAAKGRKPCVWMLKEGMAALLAVVRRQYTAITLASTVTPWEANDVVFDGAITAVSRGHLAPLPQISCASGDLAVCVASPRGDAEKESGIAISS